MGTERRLGKHEREERHSKQREGGTEIETRLRRIRFWLFLLRPREALHNIAPTVTTTEKDGSAARWRRSHALVGNMLDLRCSEQVSWLGLSE